MATTSRRICIVGWLSRRVMAAERVDTSAGSDDSALSPLAQAILEHYQARGERVKMSHSHPF